MVCQLRLRPLAVLTVRLVVAAVGEIFVGLNFAATGRRDDRPVASDQAAARPILARRQVMAQARSSCRSAASAASGWH